MDQEPPQDPTVVSFPTGKPTDGKRRKKRADSSPSTTPEWQPPAPIAGITRDNYAQFAKSFILANKRHGFMIATREKKLSNDFEVKPTIMEWGAWRSWRLSKRLSVKKMDELGVYMVPARWPFEFDADVLEGAARANGERFFDSHVAEQRRAMVEKGRSPEDRRRVTRETGERLYTEPPYPPANFPFGKKPISASRPTHPPAYGTVFYDEGGVIIPPPVVKQPKRTTFRLLR